MKPIRVLLVEDNPVTLADLASKTSNNPRLNLIAGVPTCAEARTYLQNHIIDVLLTDLDLPDGEGTELILEGLANQPKMLAMVISIFGDERHVVRAIRAGASGYLLKDGSADELGESVIQLCDGFSPISPAIAHHLIRALRPLAPKFDNESDLVLSERETEVLTLAAKGCTYQEIAELIGVTHNTVSTYTRRIYNKLAVRSKAEAIFEASRLGLMK